MYCWETLHSNPDSPHQALGATVLISVPIFRPSSYPQESNSGPPPLFAPDLAEFCFWWALGRCFPAPSFLLMLWVSDLSFYLKSLMNF